MCECVCALYPKKFTVVVRMSGSKNRALFMILNSTRRVMRVAKLMHCHPLPSFFSLWRLFGVVLWPFLPFQWRVSLLAMFQEVHYSFGQPIRVTYWNYADHIEKTVRQYNKPLHPNFRHLTSMTQRLFTACNAGFAGVLCSTDLIELF